MYISPSVCKVFSPNHPSQGHITSLAVLPLSFLFFPHPSWGYPSGHIKEFMLIHFSLAIQLMFHITKINIPIWKCLLLTIKNDIIHHWSTIYTSYFLEKKVTLSAWYAIYQCGLHSRDIVLLNIELIPAWPGEPAACRAVTLFYQSMSVYYGGLHNLPPGKPPHNFVKILAMPVWPEEPAAWRAVT